MRYIIKKEIRDVKKTGMKIQSINIIIYKILK